MVYSHWLGQEPGQGQGPGRASINQWKHVQDLKMGTRPILQVLKMFPPFLLKKFFSGPGPCPGPDSRPSQCEYTFSSFPFWK